MGFSSVYRSLTEIFPQIDARILRAVAIEHPKDADEAAAVVLSDIVPYFSSNLSRNFTQSLHKSSGSISERKVKRGLGGVSRFRSFLVSSGSKSSASSSETIPFVAARDQNSSAPSTDLVSNMNELTNLPPDVGFDVCREDVKSEDVHSLKKAHGIQQENYDFFGGCFDVLSQAKLGEDDNASVVSSVAQENANWTRDFWQDIGFDMTWNQAESITSVSSGNAVQKLVDSTSGDNTTIIQKGSCFEVGSGSTNLVDETSEGSLASEIGDTELGGAFNTSTHGCNIDHIEFTIEDAKSNTKALLTVKESVMNLIREVELQEKDAEKSKEEAARGGLDTLQKVEELKKILEHAKEANEMHAGEVYGEKSILATEVKELKNRLLNLSEERNKSLAVLDLMRETLEIRLAEAMEMKKAAEQEKKEKEDSALKALAEQETFMEKVVKESKLLQQEAEENSRLREFLMDRGQIIDSLHGEISVISEDVKLLKEKFDNRVSLTKSISSSQASSCESYMRSLVLEEEASSMSKEKDDCKDLLEDGWDIFDKETEL